MSTADYGEREDMLRKGRPPRRSASGPAGRPRAVLLGCISAGLLLLGTPSAASSQAFTVDQSFTSPVSLGAKINECCRYVAQTFTAGLSGALGGVNIDVHDVDPDMSPLLRVAIHSVEDGIPTAVILGKVVLDSDSAPLSRLITFPRAVPISAGTQYAIVVSYEAAPEPGAHQAQGVWTGATGDLYPFGSHYASLDNGATWFADPTSGDLHFRTHVHSLPTAAQDCKKGVWRNYGEAYKNQGLCTAFVKRGPRPKP